MILLQVCLDFHMETTTSCICQIPHVELKGLELGQPTDGYNFVRHITTYMNLLKTCH